MKNKVVLIFLVMVGLFMITGCGSNNNVTSEITIKDVTLKFDQETTFKNINYKNTEAIKPDESKQAVYLDYVNKDIYDGRFVFRISLAYSSESNMEELLAGKETKDIKINGLNWKTLMINSTLDKKETTSINYVIEKEDTIYVVSILSFNEAGVDIDKLANIFINGVTIK